MGLTTSTTHPQRAPGSTHIGDGVRISRLCQDRQLLELGPDDPKTTYEAFQIGQRVSDDGPYLGTRDKETGEYTWQTYSEVSAKCDAFGSGLVAVCGLKPSNSTHVGLFAQNRLEWVVADQACARFSMVTVPIYSTLGHEAMEHIVTQADLRIIICDTAARALQLVEIGLKPLQTLVVMDHVPEETREKIKAHVTLHSFQEVRTNQAGRFGFGDPL